MFIKLIEEEASSMKLQGIVTILRSNHCQGYSTKSAASIRRTLSADMSSKKWLSQNGFFNSTIKKNVSFEVLINIPNQDDVWKSIQSEKVKNDEIMMKKPAVWGEILSTNEKNKDSENCPNYVHPLLKRSARSLSDKSLEICTESLRSETGPDVYSNSRFSSDADEDHDQEVRVVVNEEYNEFKEVNDRFDDLHVVKYKKSPVRPFPPLLVFIGGGDGAASSLHMNSRHENGWLVLEAVLVPARDNFHAQRRNGRLVLSLIHKENKVEEFEKVFDIEEEKVGGSGDDDGYEEEEEEEKVATAAAEKFVVEENLRSLPSGIVMKKP
ncbi:hypothetical protein BUALT_Bualt02G0018900 [Buddleja alternifolia]|uniref:FAF domain-containing protein n=1 Tax=Buddleja alternifolia TaxID=168488 RepID=A0AAV6Y7D0_9LAMI|nr:hypothetical protein BUALT_Bualt02G0018900 [Buddleja alternifolia]